MTHPIIKTDNYILITSEEEIKLQDWCILFDSVGNLFYDFPQQYTDSKTQHINKYLRKVIAHLPLNNSPILEGLPLLPPLPNEEDNLYNDAQEYAVKSSSSNREARRKGYVDGYLKAKEKYKDLINWIDNEILLNSQYKDSPRLKEGANMVKIKIQSLSQPKLPVGFKYEIERIKENLYGFLINTISQPKIINGVMQGEWIFE